MVKCFLVLWGITVLEKLAFSYLIETDAEPVKFWPLMKVRNLTAVPVNGEYHVFDFAGLVQRHGYPVEEHLAVTEDGYNIVLHRIPGSRSSPPTPGKPVVLVQHGLMGSSDSWVLMGPRSDLPFILADAGYDVWLGNARGNTYSRSHQTLVPSMPIFWEFSFHEIGTKDLPAMIDYILGSTGRKKLHYVGFSMGTTASYVLLSQRPNYNEKIGLVVSLAPVAFWMDHRAPLERFLAITGSFLEEVLDSVKLYEVFPQSRELPDWVKIFCRGPTNPCKMIVSQIVSADLYLNATLLPYIVKYFPAGASKKTFLHLQQNMRSGKFCKYDGGPSKNLDDYGQLIAPSYDVRKITAPVALIYAMNDPIATQRDTEVLSQLLPNLATWEPVSDPKFNHIDFQWGIDVKRLVHDRIVELMKIYEGERDV